MSLMVDIIGDDVSALSFVVEELSLYFVVVIIVGDGLLVLVVCVYVHA